MKVKWWRVKTKTTAALTWKKPRKWCCWGHDCIGYLKRQLLKFEPLFSINRNISAAAVFYPNMLYTSSLCQVPEFWLNSLLHDTSVKLKVDIQLSMRLGYIIWEFCDLFVQLHGIATTMMMDLRQFSLVFGSKQEISYATRRVFTGIAYIGW